MSVVKKEYTSENETVASGQSEVLDSSHIIVVTGRRHW